MICRTSTKGGPPAAANDNGAKATIPAVDPPPPIARGGAAVGRRFGGSRADMLPVKLGRTESGNHRTTPAKHRTEVSGEVALE